MTGIMTSLWTNRERTAVTKPFGTTGIVSAKMHHTRKNTIHGHTLQTNIWSSKLLQQLFYSIHSGTMEHRRIVSIESSDHVTNKLRKYLQN